LLESLVHAAQNLLLPQVASAWLLGTIVGVILGVIPVIGGINGAALALPFIFMMDPVAMMAVSYTGGAVTSILINVPGTAANAPTMIDGYPMARKGEAGRALGAAFMSSALGGAFAVPLALLMIPVIIPLVLSLWSAEMFFLVVLGLSFLAVLGKGGQIKGLVAGGLGILFSLVGYDIVTGTPRFTFGLLGLYEGIDIIAVLLGLFGLAEIIDLASTGQAITKSGKVEVGPRALWEGSKDVFRHWWLWLRCSLLGYVIGVIPGIGAGMATFTAYAHAKQTSKYPEKFGTGVVEGVIAPEAANNAKEAGSVLTTLAFGIPGSTEMVIILGAFWMMGIVPGPGLLLDHLDISLTMLLTIVVANIVGAVICYVSVSQLARLTTVRPRYLFCIIMSIIFVGVYVNSEQLISIPIVIIFGVLGFFMKRYDYPRPSLALGFVLGSLFEHYLNMSLMASGPLFFLRPISLALIVVTITILSIGPIKSLLSRARARW
jgi:putative tricarboxylic transport membrane protein